MGGQAHAQVLSFPSPCRWKDIMAPPANEPIKLTPLQKTEYPDGYFTYVMLAEVAPNTPVARHTHPGIETNYILEGDLELTIEGKPPQKFKAGDSFTVTGQRRAWRQDRR
jgi:quercetin dioxygenase-like cupin family protein